MILNHSAEVAEKLAYPISAFQLARKVGCSCLWGAEKKPTLLFLVVFFFWARIKNVEARRWQNSG